MVEIYGTHNSHFSVRISRQAASKLYLSFAMAIAHRNVLARASLLYQNKPDVNDIIFRTYHQGFQLLSADRCIFEINTSTNSLLPKPRLSVFLKIIPRSPYLLFSTHVSMVRTLNRNQKSPAYFKL